VMACFCPTVLIAGFLGLTFFSYLSTLSQQLTFPCSLSWQIW